MRYMGGKAKIARRVVQAILDDTPARERWFEPFVGGGNVMEHAAPHFGRSVGMDVHPDLIAMWQAMSSGWEPPDITREMYHDLRNAEPSALRGYVGFGASFGGKWFGGYGVAKVDQRHPHAEAWRSSSVVIPRQAAVFAKYGTVFQCRPFGDHTPPPGTVVYCDPPYAGTTGYSTGGFDHASFYRTLRTWAAVGCHVYVSEYTVPENTPTTVIWSREKRNVLEKGDNQRISVEQLFRIN
jgi:DNA adenine methylase